MNNKKNLSGIGGWLLFLIITSSISLVLEPIVLLGVVANQELSTPNLVGNAQWQNYKILLSIIYFCMFIFKIYMINALICHRNSSTVLLAKRMLWINGPVGFFCLSILVPAITLDTWHLIGTEFPGVITTGVIAIIWTSYLNSSIRVKNTYGLKPIANENTSFSIDLSEKNTENEEDKIYAEIADELDGQNLNKAVWTKAYATCDGDEKKTRTLYINLRFKQQNDDRIKELKTTEIALNHPNLLENDSDNSLLGSVIQGEYEHVNLSLKPAEKKLMIIVSVLFIGILILCVIANSQNTISKAVINDKYLAVSKTSTLVDSSLTEKIGTTLPTPTSDWNGKGLNLSMLAAGDNSQIYELECYKNRKTTYSTAQIHNDMKMNIYIAKCLYGYATKDKNQVKFLKWLKPEKKDEIARILGLPKDW